MALRVTFLAPFLVTLLAGCNEQIQTSDYDVQLLLMDEFEAMRQEAAAGDDDALVVVDVRQPDRFAAGHIPGAINIPINHLGRNMAELATAQRIVVYASGRRTDFLSAAAAKRLIALGYSNVWDFRGGAEQWQTKHELVTSPQPEP